MTEPTRKIDRNSIRIRIDGREIPLPPPLEVEIVPDEPEVPRPEVMKAYARLRDERSDVYRRLAEGDEVQEEFWQGYLVSEQEYEDLYRKLAEGDV